MKRSYFLVITCLLSLSLSAQQTATVKGIVTDEKDNSPMIGVNVSVKGTTVGISTDDKGAYELKIPLGTVTLAFTYVGYQERNELVTSTKEGETHSVNEKMTEISKEMEIVVVSGSKVEKKIGEASQTIEVMKGENITNSAQGVQEAMNKVPGVNMIGNTISVRGGSGFSDVTSNRTLVLLDDLPLVSPLNGGVSWETMPREAISQLELVKGPATVTNGAQALSALCNVRTISPDKDSAYNKIFLDYGDYFPYRDRSWTWFWKRLDGKPVPPMYGSLAYVHARKYKDLDVVFNGAVSDNQGYTSWNSQQLVRAFVKLRYIPHKIPNLSIGGDVNFCYERYEDFFIYSNYNDTFTSIPNHKPTYNTQVLVPSDSTLGKQGAINVNPYINYYDKFGSRHSLKASYYFVEGNNTSGDSSKSQKFYLDYSFTRKFKNADADFLAGARYSYKSVSSITYGDKYSDYAAAYGQIEKRFEKRFTIKVGLSLEYNKLDTLKPVNDLAFLSALAVKDTAHQYTSPVKPILNVGLNYKITEGTFLRGSFAQGYRFPDIAEEYVLTPKNGALAIPNPDLKPESSWSAEVGLKQGMKFSRWVFYADLAAYISRYNNLIEFVDVSQSEVPSWIVHKFPNDFIFEQAQNIDHAQIWGVEVSAIGTGSIFGVPLNFLIGYNYMNPRNLDYNPNDHNLTDPNAYPYLYYRMKHSAKADIQTTYKKFIIGVTVVYIGHMMQIDPQILQLDKISSWINAHGGSGDVVMDARVGYNLTRKFAATLIAKNVTDRAYTLRPGYVEAPASITLQLTYQWGKLIPSRKAEGA